MNYTLCSEGQETVAECQSYMAAMASAQRIANALGKPISIYKGDELKFTKNPKG